MKQNKLACEITEKELKYLHVMRAVGRKCEDNTLDEGGLTCIVPTMYPFFSKMLAVVNQLINQNEMKKYGKEMIKTALDRLLENEDLPECFFASLSETMKSSDTIDKTIMTPIRVELTKKSISCKSERVHGSIKRVGA